MEPEEAIRIFAEAGSDLPKEAMGWALDNWDACAPAFLALLQRVADSDTRSSDDADALFFILHLMGEKRETQAFPILCRLARHPTALDEILGDGVTTTLPAILIATFDGNAGLLEEVIETSEADPFVRDAFFKTLTWATLHGQIPMEDTAAYLADLFHRLMPQEEDYGWVGWQEAIALLRLQHLAPLVREAFENGWIDASIMNHRDFLEDLAAGAVASDRAALLQREGIVPFEDAIGELSSWYAFSPQRKLDEEEREKRAREPAGTFSPQPATLSINPFREVGRNDPCPCGSGKKFKKCCLGKELSEAH